MPSWFEEGGTGLKIEKVQIMLEQGHSYLAPVRLIRKHRQVFGGVR